MDTHAAHLSGPVADKCTDECAIMYTIMYTIIYTIICYIYPDPWRRWADRGGRVRGAEGRRDARRRQVKN